MRANVKPRSCLPPEALSLYFMIYIQLLLHTSPPIHAVTVAFHFSRRPKQETQI